ncbi:hypothetical protein GCM10010330_44130 [Streptomyces tendae]|nr:hypothetical protein GCM10010330_44130 [Streptomyces tendae]
MTDRDRFLTLVGNDSPRGDDEGSVTEPSTSVGRVGGGSLGGDGSRAGAPESGGGARDAVLGADNAAPPADGYGTDPGIPLLIHRLWTTPRGRSAGTPSG